MINNFLTNNTFIKHQKYFLVSAYTNQEFKFAKRKGEKEKDDQFE